jgi:kynurenine formamidase
MPVYPGDPCSRLYQSAFIDKDGTNDHKIESCMHVGTHIDAPLHMVDGSLKISDIPVAHCTGRGVLLDVRGKDIIDEDCIEGIDIQKDDIVLAWTGWDKKYRTDDYFKSWPVMTQAFAQELVHKNIAMIGMDTAGPDMDSTFPAHKIFLPNNVLIIENMTGLEQLQSQNFIIHAYPVKYEADAAPVRVVAELTHNT